MITFISDLDSTLIYSQASNALCVEKIEDREISYMTPKAYSHIQKLLTESNFQLIPCTARSYEQTMRISFLKQYQPSYMICDLGASIYRNGVKDLTWEKELLSKKILCPQKISDFQSKVSSVAKVAYCRKIVSNNDYFLVFCFHNAEDAFNFYNHLQTYYKEEGLSFSISGRKIYCCPERLDKVLAVNHLQETMQPGITITSGDSLLDFNFNQRGDLALLPGHAEFLIPHGFYSKSCGIEAGEDILSVLMNLTGFKDKETI